MSRSPAGKRCCSSLTSIAAGIVTSGPLRLTPSRGRLGDVLAHADPDRAVPRRELRMLSGSAWRRLCTYWITGTGSCSRSGASRAPQRPGEEVEVGVRGPVVPDHTVGTACHGLRLVPDRVLVISPRRPARLFEHVAEVVPDLQVMAGEAEKALWKRTVARLRVSISR